MAREVRDTLSYAAFAPSSISVKAGENIRLVLTSTDLPHTFTVDELAINISVPGGQTVTQEVVIPNKPGNYKLYCGLHQIYGMTGTMVVTP